VVQLTASRELSELEEQGLIPSFEFTHELAWNVMKDWFDYQGTSGLSGSREVTREAFARGLIADGEVWMEMFRSRNLSSHTYNLETARQIAGAILKRYIDPFEHFLAHMELKAQRDAE
jgi:nucleotidyltransferase substrate binding protein (TIGR01987 family)